MKVILNSDLEGKGELGDIVEVKPGYARNYLLPKQLALRVTKHNLEVMKARRKKVEKKLEIERLSATEQKQKIEELTLTIEKKAGENDVLFGSVTTSDIENKLEELGITLDRKKLHLDEQIKRLGHYTCKIKLMKGGDADLKIQVIAEGKPPEEQQEEIDVAKEEKTEEAADRPQPEKEPIEAVEAPDLPEEQETRAQEKTPESEPESLKSEKQTAKKTEKKNKIKKESPDKDDQTKKTEAKDQEELKKASPAKEDESVNEEEVAEVKNNSPEA
ncbi:MAG: 50S ribosomal protein L9 [Candidatus Aminicenantes bacterium]|nr:50S ribosomal protein L9 [Candidatus Aminicenantes bacterium]